MNQQAAESLSARSMGHKREVRVTIIIWKPDHTREAQCTKLQKCLSQVLEGTLELSGKHAPWQSGWNTPEVNVAIAAALGLPTSHGVSLYRTHGPSICFEALSSLHPMLYFPTFLSAFWPS